MNTCMFHECGKTTFENHEVRKEGFRFCETHRTALDLILAAIPLFKRGKLLMDFWAKARPDYKPDPKKLPKHSNRLRSINKYRAKPIDPSKSVRVLLDPNKKIEPKKTVSENAFSLAGLINEEVANLATKE